MARLSEPMRAALNDAAENDCLECRLGLWRHSGPGRATWIARRTIVALTDRGLLREDGRRRVITPEGRATIGLAAIEGGDDGKA